MRRSHSVDLGSEVQLTVSNPDWECICVCIKLLLPRARRVIGRIENLFSNFLFCPKPSFMEFIVLVYLLRASNDGLLHGELLSTLTQPQMVKYSCPQNSALKTTTFHLLSVCWEGMHVSWCTWAGQRTVLSSHHVVLWECNPGLQAWVVNSFTGQAVHPGLCILQFKGVTFSSPK